MKENLKLHLGCGNKFLEGYKHIDYSEYKHIDWSHPIYPLPFINNETVQEIYCANAFQYFDSFEALLVLKEWKRCLSHNGFLRLSVPNFYQWAKLYTSGDFDIKKLNGTYFW